MAPGGSGRSGESRGSAGFPKKLGAVAALAVGAVLMTGCSGEEAVRFGWPKPVTPEARDMATLWTWSVIAALIMGILVWGLTFWTITFHRRKRGAVEEFPRQTAYNVPLELVYTAIPFICIAVLFYFTVIVQNKVEAKTDDPKVVVDVTAFQWNWKFGYRSAADVPEYKANSRKGGPFELDPTKSESNGEEAEKEAEKEGPDNGRDGNLRDYLYFNKVETVGSTREIPVLVLPVGERIEFVLAAADVVHSFWVPEFLFKRDVLPFPAQNHSDNRFQITQIDQTGAFVGRCAEMCGTFHSMMNFEVRAVSQENFKKYLLERQSGKTNAQALQAIGEQPTATTTKPFESTRGQLTSK